MRTRMKLLTVGLVLATAAMAGCSSTTGSSGAVQNDATASASSAASAAASSAASTAPAPSPDPVTPTAEPTEAPASPVASPTDSTSASDSPQSPVLGGASAANNVVCDTGLKYACGDIGASGVGTVFYASSTSFPCVANGVDVTSSCNYLEVAPNGWNGTLVKCLRGCEGSPNKTSDFGSSGPGTGRGYAYCTGTGKTSVIPNASGTLIGTGYPNTSAMLTMCDPKNAAEKVRVYDGGGMTDWSLPSQDELNALYYYTGRNAIGGFADSYWSSSASGADYAWGQLFTGSGENTNYNYQPGFQWVGDKYEIANNGVRPVRAF